MERIRNIIVLLRGQLWIVPLVMILLALGLAYWVLGSAPSLPEGLDADELWWLYGGDADTARGLLASLLSGLMTMTSLVVSVTFVILTLAANQLGPRLIPIFMGDRQIQVVLRSLDGTLGPEGVPHIGVTIGSVLTIVCLFALLFYVHKVARAIVADSIVARVAHDLHHSIDSMLQKEGGAARAVPAVLPPRTAGVSLERSGYVQVVDYDRLVAVACRESAVLQVKIRAGHFVLKGGEHVVVHAERPPSDGAAEAIRGAFVVGEERSPAGPGAWPAPARRDRPAGAVARHQRSVYSRGGGRSSRSGPGGASRAVAPADGVVRPR
ncbi:Predicted membrane protein [Microvirga guangxiensis]|uniref:Predicted membrane protein n=1 Tax=Microvirga guangxiensis TaxID=549386 RepID=A0A1G5JZ79_9HYPH|nr:Predicted membrane protein [Microvirga guangxiensis]